MNTSCLYLDIIHLDNYIITTENINTLIIKIKMPGSYITYKIFFIILSALHDEQYHMSILLLTKEKNWSLIVELIVPMYLWFYHI